LQKSEDNGFEWESTMHKTSFAGKDDVLTLLVHLGYLSFDSERRTVSIPNKEVSLEYCNAISTMD